jgi:hypothetical protein
MYVIPTTHAACNVNCHKKCERHMPNLCGIDQKVLAETLYKLRKEKSMSAMASVTSMSSRGAAAGGITGKTGGRDATLFCQRRHVGRHAALLRSAGEDVVRRRQVHSSVHF